MAENQKIWLKIIKYQTSSINMILYHFSLSGFFSIILWMKKKIKTENWTEKGYSLFAESQATVWLWNLTFFCSRGTLSCLTAGYKGARKSILHSLEQQMQKNLLEITKTVGKPMHREAQIPLPIWHIPNLSSVLIWQTYCELPLLFSANKK
jgi:hypothetical protein